MKNGEFMETELKVILGQVIDNQLILNKRMDEILKILNNLTNTIIKYDNEYQQNIVEDVNK